ncbi:P-loop containing nucleoside triphosphate hydrolase protein [Myriangium duriaei CBS 260.36]|uniref:RNA helicase n=1 Tax=Myriangium duriaei CBS 260.36 TaxID=1168546 RepID=A0A9P4J8F8_9PEZI|nr:P-loop containing nucleoside triphosphate hydrolase protein [Myriangium duriaei CBS 260.36]
MAGVQLTNIPTGVRGFVCAFCRTTRPSWNSSRSFATLHKRQPSRMVLSPKVAEKSPPPRSNGKSARRPSKDPFGGMNVTEARVEKRQPQSSVTRRHFKGSDAALGKGKSKPKKDAQPFKALKMQRALSPVSYGRRSEVKESIASNDTFNRFELLPVVKQSIGPEALRGKSDPVPSPIQRLAIPALLGTSKEHRQLASGTSMQQFLLAAETGSGKTLAYLLPVIDAFKRAEMKEKESPAAKDRLAKKSAEKDALFELDPPEAKEIDESSGRPKVMILVPTSELVDQVGAVAKSLSHTVKFRTALLSSNYSGQVIRNRLFSPSGVDVVVSTPHLLSSIIESDPNVVARVTHLVIDEADSLLDRSFSPITKAILDRATPSLKQLVLCSATIPRNLDGFLRKHFPDMIRLTTPNLHAIPRRVQLSVVDIEGDPYKSNRNLACADTIYNMGREAAGSGDESSDRVLRLIVFVNERETTEEVATFLRSKGIDAMALNRDASDRHTSDTLAEFTGAPTTSKIKDSKTGKLLEQKPSQLQTRHSKERRLDNVKVLVMTDIGSRGIDTLEVRNVILYDVPHTSIDFIHRLGRVGRMGRRGRGYVLVGKGDRKDIVKEVRTGMFMGKALI